MRFMFVVVLIALTGIVVTAQAKQPSGASEKIEAVILQLEKEGREATLNNDLAANDRLLADDWINVNPDGSITTKARLLELIKQGTFKINSIDNDEVLVRTYQNSAVVTGRSTTTRLRQNETVTRQVRFTRVYVKRNGRWQVASAHNTLIAQP